MMKECNQCKKYRNELARAGEEIYALLSAKAAKELDRPKIICFCGSSRFIEHFATFMWEYEKAGYIALGLHYLPPNYQGVKPDHQAEEEGIAKHFDELHLRKIDLADEVFILNVGGYIGESTARELAYAKEQGKKIRFLEPLGLEVEVEEKGGGDE